MNNELVIQMPLKYVSIKFHMQKLQGVKILSANNLKPTLERDVKMVNVLRINVILSGESRRGIEILNHLPYSNGY